MKKNNDKKNESPVKAKKAFQLEFDALEIKNSIERKLNELPVLTEAELDALKAKAEAFQHEMAGKGCWLGLGSFRTESREEPMALVQASGSLSLLALMVAEAMEHNPALEKVFLMAVGLKMKFGEDDNEEEE